MSTKNNTRTAEIGVIYARYSSTGQREESIEGQLRDCHAFADRYGITVVGEYCDRALTGTSDRRPDFQRMIRDSAKGQFSVVITWKNDRFARSRYDSAIYKAKLKANGVRVLYAKEAIPEGPEGIILESVMEGFAEYYSANLSQNVKRGNYDSALKRQTLGQTVLGLRKGADKRFEIDPATAPIVRKIFQDYAKGVSAKTICEELNAAGHTTSLGHPFNKNSVRRILENEKYVGVYTYKDIIRDENGIPPIIDRELFDKVQRMLDRRHRAPASKPEVGGFLLTSKLFCGECGSPMIGDGGTGKSGRVYSYYSCKKHKQHTCPKHSIRKDVIEDAVIDALAQVVNDDSMIERIAGRFMDWQAAQPGNDDVLDGLVLRLRQVETAISNNMSLIDSGFISESVKSHLIDLEAQRKALEAGIAKERTEGQAPKIRRSDVVFFLRRFRTEDTSDIGWRVQIIGTFLSKVFLYDDGRLILHLNFTGKENTITLQMAEVAASDGELLCSDIAPSGAPRRSKLYIACSDFFKSQSALMPLLLLPNRTRSAGLRFGSWVKTE